MRAREIAMLIARGGRGGRRAHVASPTLSVAEIVVAALAPEPDLHRAERCIAECLQVPEVVLFASARAALAAAIETSGAQSEVVLPAYTCVAVASAAKTAGVDVTFGDVNGQGLLNVDLSGGAGRTVVIQDTYGFPAALPDGPTVIRDCSHRVDLVAVPGPRASVTSFEHSKWLSAGHGGLAVAWDPETARKLREVRSLGRPTRPRYDLIFTLLMVIGGRLAYRGWRLQARPFMQIAAMIDRERFAGQGASELMGGGVRSSLMGAPGASVARLILSQVRKAGDVHDRRAHVVELYDRAAGVDREPLPLVRYPMVTEDPHAFEATLRAQGWDVAGRWFTAGMHPAGVAAGAFGYEPTNAPQAQQLAATVVNLPTHPLVSDGDATVLIGLALAAGARPL